MEAVFHQQRDTARVVDVRVGDEQNIDIAEEMFSDLASQAQEARCVRSAQIFAAALCALGAAMQFYTAWEYLYAAQIYEELYAELIAAGGPSVVAAWMPRIALEAVLGLSWLALAVWGASAAVRTHKKWKKIKDEQCICE